MKIIDKVINNIPVKIIKTNKFKSTIVALGFKNLVTKDNITSYSLLRSVLSYSCKKYNTNELLNLKLLDNYNAYFYGNTSRLGKYIINSFYIETLDDKYTKNGNLNEVIDLFYELLFNPNVKDNAFLSDAFDICYKDMELALKKVEESNSSLARKNIYNYLNENKEYTYLKSNESLSKITKESLFETYKDMIKNSDAQIIVCENVDENINLDKITKKLNNKNRYNNSLYITNDDENSDYKVIKETGKGNENIHYLVGYLKNLNHYEMNYVVPIYRYILGSTGNSRLFNTVREKNSLAYYCFARYEKDENLMFIITGCEKDNYDKLNIILKKEINKMNKITNKELENAKKQIAASLLSSSDNLLQTLKRKAYEELFNLPDVKDFINKLNSVTKKDVEEISKKIDFKINYFLEGN